MLGGVIQITLHAGDLLDARSDTILLGVSTDLLIGASALEEELKRPENAAALVVLDEKKDPVVADVLVAPAGSLRTSHLLFTVTHSELTPPTEESVGRCVALALDRAASLGATSVAMPPLGTRLCHFTMAECARATYRAVAAFAASHGDGPMARVDVYAPYDTDLAIWEQERDALARAASRSAEAQHASAEPQPSATPLPPEAQQTPAVPPA